MCGRLCLLAVLLVGLVFLSQALGKTPQRIDLSGTLSPPFIETPAGFEKLFPGGKLLLKKDGTLNYRFRKFSFLEKIEGVSSATLTPLAPQKAKINVFLGNNPSSWKKFLTWGKVSFGEVYAGITLELISHPQNVEKIFRLAPGAKVEKISLKLLGIKGLQVLPDGRLEITKGQEKVYFSKPVAYQEIEGKRREVQVSYVVKGISYGFRLGAYDPRFPVVIDPQIIFATYLGGERYDAIEDIVTDPQGNIYFAGVTKSDDLPVTTGARYPSQVNQIIWAGKISPGPEFRLLYLTYLGGEGYARTNQVTKIVATPTGELVLTGYTTTETFPLINEAFGYPREALDREYGFQVGFLTKLDRTGNIAFSTYLGESCRREVRGEYGSIARGLGLDDTGNIIVAGNSFLPFSSSDPEAPCYSYTFYILRFSNRGYLLASLQDLANSFIVYDLAVNTQGDVCLAGKGSSEESANYRPFATLRCYADGPYQGFQYLFSYLLRGTGSDDRATSVAFDEAGNIYVAGYTYATDLPGADGRLSGFDRQGQFFVTKLSPGPEVVYTILLGKEGLEGVCGSDRHRCFDMAVDASGNIFLTGSVSATYENSQEDFPLTDDAWEEYNFGHSAFFTQLNPSGNLVFSTRLPKIEPFCITQHAGKVFLAGRVSYPSDLEPEHAIQEEHAQTLYGRYDGFILGIDLGETPPPSPSCDAEHLDLCDNQAACEAAGGYWCDGTCQDEPCPGPAPSPGSGEEISLEPEDWIVDTLSYFEYVTVNCRIEKTPDGIKFIHTHDRNYPPGTAYTDDGRPVHIDGSSYGFHLRTAQEFDWRGCILQVKFRLGGPSSSGYQSYSAANISLIPGVEVDFNTDHRWQGVLVDQNRWVYLEMDFRSKDVPWSLSYQGYGVSPFKRGTLRLSTEQYQALASAPLRVGLNDVYEANRFMELGEAKRICGEEPPGRPVPQIKINGRRGSLRLGANDWLSLTVSLDPQGETGPGDYYLWVKIPSGVCFCYAYPGRWQLCACENPVPAYQGWLIPFEDLPLFRIPCRGLPYGVYKFWFAVDDTADGRLAPEAIPNELELEIR